MAYWPGFPFLYATEPTFVPMLVPFWTVCWTRPPLVTVCVTVCITVCAAIIVNPCVPIHVYADESF